MQETQVQSLGWEDFLERKCQPTPVFLPGEFHGQKSLVGYSTWGRNELAMTDWSLGIFRFLPWEHSAGLPVMHCHTFLGQKWPRSPWFFHRSHPMDSVCGAPSFSTVTSWAGFERAALGLSLAHGKCWGIFTPNKLCECKWISAVTPPWLQLPEQLATWLSLLGSSLQSSGLPWWLRSKESACQCRRLKRHRFSPLVRKIPWRRAWKPTPVFLPGELHGQRSLTGYRPCSGKESQTWLSD